MACKPASLKVPPRRPRMLLAVQVTVLLAGLVATAAADEAAAEPKVDPEAEAKFTEAHKLQKQAATLLKEFAGKPQDHPEASKLQKDAIVLLKAAAKAGHAKAMNNLGVMHKAGLHGAPKGDEMAVKWFAEAAEKGLAEGEVNLASMLLAGRGVEKDEKLALVMLHRAADKGDDDAMLQLAKHYAYNATGLSMVEQERTAMDWLRKAAAKGNERAKELLHTEL
eukprot:gnl/TRDRNA2_/TRDRNA2_170066_c0_seq1.p1 gnl/TRDRNA2_/TRDRNA2_170066_c0~~gnl/TRDRNA2_/TRDRNA2_170066_c0_seq1.p1  ORF type:complete len:223 (+),score=73.59 gnl/TRDRNA2_/TRDRNA2_170066_c0_seq1:75-743(+)